MTSTLVSLLLALTLTNPTSTPWVEAPVVVDVSAVSGIGHGKGLVAVGTEILPVQADDFDKDGKADELVFLASIPAGVSRQYRIEKSECAIDPPKRSHAGMYVKGFEGPGWESDRLAFRLYWDARNATDIFCKRKPGLGLQQYAKPEVNYHQDTPWGMDVLKVKTAVGIGGWGVWVDGKLNKVEKAERDFEVLADGPIRSIIDLKYTNWEVGERRFNLTARLSMIAGQRFSTTELWLTPAEGDSGPLPELVTGFVKHDGTTLIQDKAAGVVGRWGHQALGPGEVPNSADLGLGVAVDPANIVEFGEDAVNTYVRLRGENAAPKGMKPAPSQSYVRYRTTASWVHEPAGAKSAAEFETILRDIAAMKPAVAVEPADKAEKK